MGSLPQSDARDSNEWNGRVSDNVTCRNDSCCQAVVSGCKGYGRSIALSTKQREQGKKLITTIAGRRKWLSERLLLLCCLHFLLVVHMPSSRPPKSQPFNNCTRNATGLDGPRKPDGEQTTCNIHASFFGSVNGSSIAEPESLKADCNKPSHCIARFSSVLTDATTPSLFRTF